MVPVQNIHLKFKALVQSAHKVTDWKGQWHTYYYIDVHTVDDRYGILGIHTTPFAEGPNKIEVMKNVS